MRKRDVIIFIVIIGMSIIGFNRISHANSKNQQEIVEQAISCAVTQCYAIEGFYPQDINYIQQHYGLQIDSEKYIIHYESIGSNIIPNIKVIPGR